MNSLEQLSPAQITTLQSQWTSQWHQSPSEEPGSAPLSHVERNHRMNFDLWHEEDIARRDDVDSDRIRQAKRTIDKCNQARNDAMEQIDGWIENQLQTEPSQTNAASATLHSETPGMMIDRLSILALKEFHMLEEANRESADDAHRQRCAHKADVIKEQRADLQECLRLLIGHLEKGERRFKLYRQFKMYNDATLNPQLYAANKQA